MKTRKDWQGAVMFAVILLALLGLCTTSAMAVYMKKLSIEEIAKKADVICIGTVAKKESRWVSGHIETTMTINVSEYLKGNIGSVVEITQMGGVLEEPVPIAQHVTGMPEFYTNEEVLLFLSTQKRAFAFTPPKPPNPKSRLLDSPQVVGLEQGKYSIITDPRTGEKRVTRFRLENVAILPHGKDADEAFKAMTQPPEAPPANAPQSPLANVPKSRIRELSKAGLLPSSSPSSTQGTVKRLKVKPGSSIQEAMAASKTALDEAPAVLGKDPSIPSQVSRFGNQLDRSQAVELPADEEAIPPVLRFSTLKTLNDFTVEIETILNQ